MSQVSKLLLVLILVIASITQVTMDIYTPSLPAIAHDFATSIAASQFSVTVFIIGLSLSLLIWGPLADHHGRKTPILIGMVIAIVGSVICASAQSIGMLYAGRIVQGIGCGAGAGLYRAILRDLFHGNDFARVGSILGNLIIITMVSAPFLGGYFEQYLGWRATFIFLTIYTIAAIILVQRCFRETSQSDLDKFSFKSMLHIYKTLLFSREYMAGVLSSFLVFGCLMAWLVEGPVLLIQQLKLAPSVFGNIMLLVAVPMYLAGVTNAKLVHRFGIRKMFALSWSIMATCGLVMLICHYTVGLNVYAIVIPVLVGYFGISITFPNASAVALSPFGHAAGYAGSFFSFIQLLGGVFFTAILAHINQSHDQFALALTYLIAPITAAIVFAVFMKGQCKT